MRKRLKLVINKNNLFTTYRLAVHNKHFLRILVLILYGDENLITFFKY